MYLFMLFGWSLSFITGQSLRIEAAQAAAGPPEKLCVVKAGAPLAPWSPRSKHSMAGRPMHWQCEGICQQQYSQKDLEPRNEKRT
jgi:hypothetical protein